MTDEDPWRVGDIRIGRCKLCWQELLLADGDDCWHPHDVYQTCPPEPKHSLATKEGYDLWQEFYKAGYRPGRPGADNWEPIPEDAFRVIGTSFMVGEKFYLKQIVSFKEAVDAGLKPKIHITASGRRMCGYHFDSHEYKPPTMET